VRVVVLGERGERREGDRAGVGAGEEGEHALPADLVEGDDARLRLAGALERAQRLLMGERQGVGRHRVGDPDRHLELGRDLVGEGRIGVLVKLKAADAAKASDAKLKEFGFDLALHAAAFNPAYLNRSKVDPAWLKEQEDIMRVRDAEQLAGKPDNIVAGIMKGKVDKFLKQISFVDQPFVKDDKITVTQAAENVGKTVGTKVDLADFVYVAVGAEA